MKKTLNENVANQISRMKEMMNYGLKTESKAYSSVEYERKGADGKMYAIIREGAKYHIKSSDKKNPTKSDYGYIGGFANHKTNMFESYANALKHFDMKMTSLNEAMGKRGKTDSWNVNGREDLVIEGTEKMRLEIARQKEIMKNAALISEGKDKGIDKTNAACIEKNNIRLTKPKTGDATNQGGDFFTEKPEKEVLGMEKTNIKGKQKPVLENVEDEFMDMPLSGGINIGSNNNGDGAGQTNVMGGGVNGGLGEEEDFEDDVLDTEDGDFDTEDGDFDAEEADFDTEEEDSEEDDELEEFPEEDEEEFEEDDEDEDAEEGDIASLRAEIESLRNTIEAMAEKMGVDEFDTDEPLYDDDEEEVEYEFETDDEDGDDEEAVEYEVETEDDVEDEEDEDEDDTNVFESVKYRALMEGKLGDKLKKVGKKVVNKVRNKIADTMYDLDTAPNPTGDLSDEEFEEMRERHNTPRKKKGLDETELHVFGKHPRFRKEPMTTPSPKMAKKPGQYEEGADDDNTNRPYGTQIGNGSPFGDGECVKVEADSIAEAVWRKLSKNL